MSDVEDEVLEEQVKRARLQAEWQQPAAAVRKETKTKKKKAKRPSIALLPTCEHLKLQALQQLILWAFDLTPANPRACGLVLENRAALKKFVAVIVEGLDPQFYANCSAQLPSLAPFAAALRVKLPGNKSFVYPTAHALLHSRRTNAKSSGPETCCRSAMVLSPGELQQYQYPLPSDAGDAQQGFVFLTKTAAATPLELAAAPLFAIDCEMCTTDAGAELTRVSVVSEGGDVVLDTLVKPTLAIRDYKTDGITAAMLASVTTTLADVQQQLQELLPKDAILIGHSLENDLRALKVHHDRVIDTAVVFSAKRDNGAGVAFKSSLRWLAQQLLKRSIQDGAAGHNSIEDARTCLDLVTRRMREGAAFAILDFDESIFSHMDRGGKRACMLDRPHGFRDHLQYGVHLIPCHSDEDAAAGCATASATESQFVVVRMHGLKEAADAAAKASEAPADPSASKAALQQAAARLDANLQRVLAGHEAGTALCVVGSGDISAVAALRRQKSRDAAGWTPALEDQLNAAAARARETLAFLRCV